MKRAVFSLAVLFAADAAPALAQPINGRIEGRVVRADASGIGGVTVVIQETGAATVSDPRGAYTFGNLPDGRYTLGFAIGSARAVEPGVEVDAGRTTRLETTIEGELPLVESVTVYSASRFAERVADAPAAVTVVPQHQIEREATHGQLPKLLEFTPGAEVTQSGVYDYNFNTRGFNSSLNRRVATLIDGRDPSVPFLGAQEWAALSMPLDDLAAVEFIRGPSAALYGANASSGVLNLTSKDPRLTPGGMVRITAGELSTVNADVRWAGELGNDWHLRVVGGLRDSGDFSVSRQGAAEYSTPCPVPQGSSVDCLPQEAVPLARVDDNDVTFTGVRADRHYPGGQRLTIEAGRADVAGPIFQTGIGRVQVLDVARPWSRVNYSTENWNFLAYYNRRKAPRQLALASGANLALDSENYQVEVQRRWSSPGDRLRVVGGVSYSEERIDSFDRAIGRQSLMFAPVQADFTALFGQADWRLSDRLKLVGAARYDAGTLHDGRLSPKASLVWSVREDHTLRFTYNEAFQVPNYSEFFLQADVQTPVNLSGFEALCTAEGVTCGFGSALDPRTWTRVLALGNDDLEVEKIQTLEVGYTGILAKRAYVTLDYYVARNQDFITDLIPNLDAMGNRTNADFGPYVPPEDLSPGARLALLTALTISLPPQRRALLSNNLDGTPIFAAVSYTNFGEVDTQGLDLAVNYYFDENWSASFSGSWFDFDLSNPSFVFADQLLPNSPEFKGSLRGSYVGSRLDANLGLRWVDDFRWVVGPFQGDVESYTTVDLSGNWRLAPGWIAGINVANLLDDEHWEAFGGDLLGRRALAHVVYQW